MIYFVLAKDVNLASQYEKFGKKYTFFNSNWTPNPTLESFNGADSCSCDHLSVGKQAIVTFIGLETRNLFLKLFPGRLGST